MGIDSKYKQYEPIFGSWYITGFLGRGSFGEVYEITREEFGITYKSALKIISIPQDENDIKRRMLEGTDLGSISEYYEDILKSIVSENDIMSRLKGRTNIVSYEDHQIIQHEDGIGYDILIRMELLTPLIDHMLENGMKEQDVVDLGIDICKAIELIHSRKIIHRDIKPQNIFVSDDGDYKLGDFGIARTLEKTTGSLSAKGTYNYMAPEVFKGDKYDKTVDIYSLGLVMYSLLNGNRGPFLPPAPEKTTYKDEEEARNRRLSGEELPQPSFASDMLGYIINKACAADSNDRCQDAGQLRRDLERYRNNYGLHNATIASADAVDDTLDETVYDTPEDVIEETVYDEVSVEETSYDDEKTELDEANIDTVALMSSSDNKHIDDITETMGQPDTSGLDSTTQEKKAKNKGLIPMILIAISVVLIGVLIFTGISKKDAGISKIDNRVNHARLSVSEAHTVWIETDGTVRATGSNHFGQCNVEDWKDIVDVSAGDYHTVGLKSDGTVLATGDNDCGQCNVEDWEDIVDVSAGDYHTVGLKSNGTVLAIGNDASGQCNVGDWKDIVAISAGGSLTVGLKSNGTVLATGVNDDGRCNVGDWKDIVAISAGTFHIVGLKSDGTVLATGYDGSGECNVEDWKDIVAISAGKSHTVGLKADGTVIAIGNNASGQCNVEDWKGIVAVSAGENNTVGIDSYGNMMFAGFDKTGQSVTRDWLKNVIQVENDYSDGPTVRLKSDGTVLATGYNSKGRWKVDEWEDIVAISVGEDRTVGLKSNGTVLAKGNNDCGQCNVEDWKDIVAVSTGYSTTVGLKSDGTLVATGYFSEGRWNVDDWKDIVAISAGQNHIVGLKSDGTVLATGDNDDGQCDVEDWKDIVAVSTGYSTTVGLKSDGTVLATGDNDCGQCNVEDWKDIVAVSTGYLTGSSTTVGLKSDGTVVATGSDYDGACDVSEWRDVQKVYTNGKYTLGMKKDGTWLHTFKAYD